MDVKSLMILINNNSSDIFKAKEYKEYLNKMDCLIGLDFINKFLVLFQNRLATDVNSELGWAAKGRILRDINSPIYILVPNYRNRYIDVASGDEVSRLDLNTFELDRAVKLGLIKKEVSLIDFKSTIVYNITDTRVVNEQLNDRYTNSNKMTSIKTSKLLKLGYSVCGYRIVKGKNETSYDIETNTITVGEEQVIDKITAIIDIIIRCMVSRMDKEYRLYTIDDEDITYKNRLSIEGIHKRLLIESAVYATCKILGIQLYTDFEYISRINIDKDKEILIDILNSVDNIVYTVTRIFKDDTELRVSLDITEIEKAESLLDIMEANFTRLAITGGVV